MFISFEIVELILINLKIEYSYAGAVGVGVAYTATQTTLQVHPTRQPAHPRSLIRVFAEHSVGSQ